MTENTAKPWEKTLPQVPPIDAADAKAIQESSITNTMMIAHQVAMTANQVSVMVCYQVAQIGRIVMQQVMKDAESSSSLEEFMQKLKAAQQVMMPTQESKPCR